MVEFYSLTELEMSKKAVVLRSEQLTVAQGHGWGAWRRLAHQENHSTEAVRDQGLGRREALGRWKPVASRYECLLLIIPLYYPLLAPGGQDLGGWLYTYNNLGPGESAHSKPGTWGQAEQELGTGSIFTEGLDQEWPARDRVGVQRQRWLGQAGARSQKLPSLPCGCEVSKYCCLSQPVRGLDLNLGHTLAAVWDASMASSSLASYAIIPTLNLLFSAVILYL